MDRHLKKKKPCKPCDVDASDYKNILDSKTLYKLFMSGSCFVNIENMEKIVNIVNFLCRDCPEQSTEIFWKLFEQIEGDSCLGDLFASVYKKDALWKEMINLVNHIRHLQAHKGVCKLHGKTITKIIQEYEKISKQEPELSGEKNVNFSDDQEKNINEIVKMLEFEL